MFGSEIYKFNNFKIYIFFTQIKKKNSNIFDT